MSLLRQAVAHSRPVSFFCHRAIRTSFTSPFPVVRNQSRAYAKAKSSPQSTSTLVPGSQQPITDEAARLEYSRASEKMSSALDWFRRECVALETRASGRVTPALLDPVRVLLGKGKEGSVKLNEVATVGVRDGSMLLVTAFEEYNVKFIESGIYDAKLPGISPQRHDARTIKIPIPKPTIDARTALYTTAHRQAEETRVQIRKHHQASVKRGKYEKHSIELEEFQKLADRFISEVDKVLAQVRKTTGAR